MRPSRLAVLGLLLLGVVATPASSQGPVKIRLAVHTQTLGAPDVIAIRQGFYRQQGLDIDWRRFALGKDGRDAMIAGAIDINATASTPFLVGLDKGVPYTAIAVNSYFCGTNHVVVAKGSDLNSVAQLKGKKVGLPKGTITEHIFLSRIAPAHGLKKGEFEVANIPDAKDRIPSLIAKAIDAAALNDPFVSIGEHDGLFRCIDKCCMYDPLPFIATATAKIVKEHPDAVVAYLRGWLQAVRLLKEQPERAAAIYAEEQREMGREVPVAVLDRALRRMRWEPELTPEIDRYLVDQAKELVAGGQLRAVPDVARGLSRDLLQKAMASR
jgi:ABC-type nitrate/sulfonate/bicarbonate transport system substrate-binding protein